jgi:ubiquitin-conjugating enzyme E2 M
MIKLFSMKNQKKDQLATTTTTSSSEINTAVNGINTNPSPSKRSSAAQLRITKDMNELTLPNTCKLDFPDKDDFLNFKLVICPDEVSNS